MKIYPTEDESVKIIELTQLSQNRGRAFHVSFGSRVSFDSENPRDRWQVLAIARWRGVEMTEDEMREADEILAGSGTIPGERSGAS